MAKRKLKFSPVIPDEKGVIAKAIAKVVAGVNMNTLVMGILGAYFTYQSTIVDDKQDAALEKQKSQALWMAKRDSINKIMFAKQDSILTILKQK